MQLSIRNFLETIENDRVDAEYFGPEYIQSDRVLKTKTCKTLGTITHISDGNHLSIAENFLDKPGIRYLRGQDLSTEMVLSDRNIVYIDEVIFRQLKRSHIFKNDILITIVGANTGLVGLVYAPPDKLVASCKLGIVRPQKGILSGYLYAFLTSQYGQNQIFRSIRGGGQTGLILPDIRKLSIARFEDAFEDYIHQIVYQGHELIEQAENIYCEAEKILLSELGLVNWKPKHRLSFIKNFSNTQTSERIDAEYFQPKFDEIKKIIFKEGSENLEANFDVIRNSGLQYFNDGFIGVIKTKQLNSKFIDFNVEDITKLEFNNPLIEEQDVLFASMGVGSLGKANILYSFEMDNKQFTIDSTLKIFRQKKNAKISPELLAIFLQSIPCQELIYQNIVGSSGIISIYEGYIKKLPIPIIKREIEEQIVEKVQDSHLKNQQSKILLDTAKRGVEMAIEKNEAIAEKWIRAEIKKLGVEITV